MSSFESSFLNVDSTRSIFSAFFRSSAFVRSTLAVGGHRLADQPFGVADGEHIGEYTLDLGAHRTDELSNSREVEMTVCAQGYEDHVLFTRPGRRPGPQYRRYRSLYLAIVPSQRGQSTTSPVQRVLFYRLVMLRSMLVRHHRC